MRSMAWLSCAVSLSSCTCHFQVEQTVRHSTLYMFIQIAHSPSLWKPSSLEPTSTISSIFQFHGKMCRPLFCQAFGEPWIELGTFEAGNWFSITCKVGVQEHWLLLALPLKLYNILGCDLRITPALNELYSWTVRLNRWSHQLMLTGWTCKEYGQDAWT